MGCASNAVKIKNNQSGQLLDLLNLCKGFQPPVGQIKDSEQLKNCQIFNKFNKELSGLRRVREDQNQFYNIIFFNYFSWICETKSNQKFQKILKLCDELEWKVFYKSKTYLNFTSKLKEQFKKTLQISFEKSLFEFFYNDISDNDSFYALSIIFMRNWIFKLKLKPEKNATYDKILDWDIDFNFEDQNLLDEISRTIDMTISVLDVNNSNLKNQNNSQIIIVKQQQNLFVGLEQNYFKRLVPSSLIYTLYQNTCLSRQVAVEFQNFVGQNFNKQLLINEYGLSNEMFQQIQLQGFKRVRGDGNCFYNTIIFQYLKYIICEFNDTEFAQFLKTLDKIKFYIKHQTILNYSDDLQLFHKKMFKSIVYEIRGWQNRAEKFEAEFANTNNIFYALAIIYIKNLCHYLVSESQDYKTFLGDEALDQIREWEFETDNIQVLLIVMKEYLKLQLHLYMINSDLQQVDKQDYETQNQNQEKQYDIFLIYNPGHYCIGLKEL